MKATYSRIGWIITLLLLVGGVQYYPAHALEQKKDYWYVETLEVGDVLLPEGIHITPSDPSSTPRGYLTLTNENDQPVYVMPLGYKDVLVMATPDALWKLRVDGAQEVASYLVGPNRPAHLTIESLTDLDQHLKDQNVLSSKPPPQNHPLPASQNSELLLVYDGQVMELPFTITYSLNTRYDNGTPPFDTVTETVGPADHPAAKFQPDTSVRQMSQVSRWVIGAAGSVTVLVFGILVWRRVRRND